MIEAKEITHDELETRAAELGINLPIEQTATWAAYQATIEGRTPWGCVALEEDGRTLALISLIDYETHGYHYLRASHAPVWAEQPSEATEAAAIDALAAHVRGRDRKQKFMRISILHELASTTPVLSGIPYDNTVVIDVTGGDDEILARMKPRGRRDVRKALRESPVTCADETDHAAADFSEYYTVMVETAQRDGFSPAPQSDYEDMIRLLGPKHCRVYAGRDEGGRVVTWSIVTINGTRAVRYYGASLNETMRQHVTDKLVYFECCDLGANKGCLDYDMMAIGSDFSPKLLGLNEFKTKFTKQVTAVAPDRDVPLHKGFYRALTTAKSLRDRKAEKAATAKAEKPREDLVPIVLGGDIGAYALAREFHEAYHVKPQMLASAPIAAVAHSQILDVHPVEHLSEAEVTRVVTEIAQANAEKTCVVVGNTDALIKVLSNCRESFPANCITPIPDANVIDRVSDKVTFAELCRKHGLDTPLTEVVHLAGTDAIAPSAIPFPLVAKPARSSEYAAHMAHGFKKVYFVHEQAELDRLWAALREDGFAGDFLVQELIEGDDTYMDSLTLYMGANGKAQLAGSAQVLLEDHAPSMLGNPVVMITRPMPELWEKAAELLESVGYRGFANFDIKRDKKTGRTLFIEVNPRMGRNSYYVCAAGVNPMRALVTDVVDGRGKRLLKADEKVLYTLVPLSLAKRYVLDPALAAEVDELIGAGKVVDPQRYAVDMAPRRRLAVELTEKNQIRKFGKYYPKPTETSF
ncbi:GNAT family N-acetyltransferase [Parolsenella catena]|uniref:GNAT family N-acetyltransferase n=1 Tax=Parolsenella catena TaxID=2003188 RepID=UPI002FE378B4